MNGTQAPNANSKRKFKTLAQNASSKRKHTTLAQNANSQRKLKTLDQNASTNGGDASRVGKSNVQALNIGSQIARNTRLSVSLRLNAPTRDASPPLVLEFGASVLCLRFEVAL